MALTTAIQTPKSRRELADDIERVVKQELRDAGLYISSDDTFDLDDRGHIVLVSGTGDMGYLPEVQGEHRLSALVATTIYLRDMDQEAR